MKRSNKDIAFEMEALATRIDPELAMNDRYFPSMTEVRDLLRTGARRLRSCALLAKRPSKELPE